MTRQQGVHEDRDVKNQTEHTEMDIHQGARASHRKKNELEGRSVEITWSEQEEK